MSDELLDTLDDVYYTSIDHAGFGLRVAAYVVDVVIQYAFLMSVIFTFSSNFQLGSEEIFDFGSMGVGMVIYLFSVGFFWLFYNPIFESSTWQGSPGKKMARIKVTDKQGRPISFMRAFGRNLGKMLSAMILMLGYLMVIWSSDKQALHDMMSDCYVLKA